MIQCIVLDIGEILLRLDFGPFVRHLGFEEVRGIGEALRVLDGWDLYDRFERGEVTEWEFHTGLQTRSGRSCELEEFRRAFNSVIVGPFPGIEGILTRLAARVPLYALTNTNQTHMAHVIVQYPWLSTFRKIFTSHELRARKPEPRIFELVAEAVQVPPADILFIDDREENVRGARQAGFQAEICRSSPAELMEILKRYSLV